MNCYSCNDGKTLTDGWKCDVCGRLNSKDANYLMEEWMNVPVEFKAIMSKQKLRVLELLMRDFIDFVDLRDSRSVANARTNEWSVMLLVQHEKNKEALNSALGHIIAVKNSPV